MSAVVRGFLDLPWSKAKELVSSGRVRVDGELVFDPAERVKGGAVVELDPTGPRRKAEALEPERILHVDHDIVVVNKPPGVVTVPFDDAEKAHDRHSLLARTRQALKLMQRKSGQKVVDGLGVVQRLDKDTTGVLVFARTHAARKRLQAQLRVHSILRHYLAIACGDVREQRIETYIVPDRGDGRRGSWRGSGKPPKLAKKAITEVIRLQELQGASLVRCSLETGRQHQIRIHLSEAGHPLVGEKVYRHGAPPADLPRAPRPMLHAASLGFRHPAHDRPVQFEVPLPADFEHTLQSLIS